MGTREDVNDPASNLIVQLQLASIVVRRKAVRRPKKKIDNSDNSA
jgi:hypothetical protein